VDAGQLGRVDHHLVGHLGVAESDVLSNGCSEQGLCVTMPICLRSDLSSSSARSRPSNRIRPDVGG
jgi:hypothetical protein